jgi:Cu/Ag efflux protein CusF
LKTELRLDSYPETFDWLLKNKNIDMALEYDQIKYSQEKQISMEFSIEERAKIKQLKNIHKLNSINEVVWRLLNSKTSDVS